jgi:hypothetical protein
LDPIWTASPEAARRSKFTPAEKSPVCSVFSDGEGRNRTGDTTIFSRVLYQLSYLAARGHGSGSARQPAAL